MLLAFGSAGAVAVPLDQATAAWLAQFAREVNHRLDVQAADQAHYVVLLNKALVDGSLAAPAHVVPLMDCRPQV